MTIRLNYHNLYQEENKKSPMNIGLHQTMITTCSTIDGTDDHRRREEGDRRAERGTDSVVYGNSDHAETNIGIGQKGWRPKKHNDEIVGFLLSRTGQWSVRDIKNLQFG